MDSREEKLIIQRVQISPGFHSSSCNMDIGSSTLGSEASVTWNYTLTSSFVSNLSVYGIHFLSSTSLHGKAQTQAHEGLYLRLTNWGKSQYFSVYGATLRPKLEFGSFTGLCTWIYPIIWVTVTAVENAIQFKCN